MRVKPWFLGVYVGLAGLLSCFDPPEFPIQPAIEFKEVSFKEVGTTSDPDSIVLVLDFKDGDGDLGLSANETDEPYNDKYYFVSSATGELITYKFYGEPGFESLPPFADPYNCTNWIINPLIEGQVVNDTVYFELNPNHFNIFVQFFVKQNDGTFKEFNWLTEFKFPNCGIAFHGRFPVLSKNLERKIPLEGTLRYGLASTGFKVLFGAKTLKLRVWIQDRALNVSNTVETNEFNLL
jgi:hypothetical protein